MLELPPPLAPLAAWPQFIIVRLVPSTTKPGKTDKFPIDWRDGSVSNAHDPAIWVDAKTACAMAPVWGADHCVGFVFTRDAGFWFLDVDGCLQPDGTWSPIARELCAALPGAAVEISQSGRGLHLFGRGLVPPHSSRRGEAQQLGLEFYTEGRFVALTGQGAIGSADADLTLRLAHIVARYFPPAEMSAAVALDAGPVPEWRGPADDDELIRRALQSKSAGSIFGGKASFADLWTADEAALARAFPATGDDPYDRSSADAALAQHLAFWTGKDGARIERLMRRSGLVRDKWDNREDYLAGRTIANALRMQKDVLHDRPKSTDPKPVDYVLQTADGIPMVYTDDPMNSARAMLAHTYGGHGLRYWRSCFYRWKGAAWLETPTDDVRAACYTDLEAINREFKPNQSKVSNVVDALKAAAHLDSAVEAPCWIKGEAIAPATELLPCANGLLHLTTGHVYPSTPDYFNLNALPLAYDPSAGAPAQWLAFLSTVWPNDPEAINALQEVFGYLLTPDTSQHKIFLIVGPRRSGKGTIARVLTELIGQNNVAGTSFSSLAGRFGLQPLIGKTVAVMSDARLGRTADPGVIAENLLRVSGEDRVDVDRKGIAATTVRLYARFLLLTNELPRLADASGALASRFVTLVMTESFLGKEDPGLTARLLRELPGVLLWAIEGWRRLRARGYFLPPASSAQAAQDLADLGSPISAFIREECTVEPAAEVGVACIYQRWQTWCIRQGITHVGSAQTFGRDLRAAVPGLQDVRPRVAGGGRERAYRGIGVVPMGVP
jgi:putative DNA primase/helicase